MRTLSLLALLASCFPAGATQTPGQALSKLLKNVTFNIPDLPIPPIKVPVVGQVSLSVTNIVCTDIAIVNINLSDEKNIVSLDAGDFSFGCTAEWAYKQKNWPHASGKGSVDIKVSKSSVGVKFAIARNSEHVPDHVHLDPAKDCTCAFDISSLRFKGGVSADLLELFHKAIASALNKALSDIVCAELSNVVNGPVDSLLFNFSKTLSKLVVPPAPGSGFPPPPPKIRKKLVDWSELSILTGIDKVLNARGHLDPHHFVAGNIIKQLESDDGQLSADFNLELHLGDDGITDTNITISSVGLKGLETISNFSIFSPLDRYGLSSHIEMDHVEIVLNGTVSLGPGSLIGHTTEGVLTAPASLSIDASNVLIQLDAALAIFQDRILNMSVIELAEPLCLLSSFYEIELTQTLFDVEVLGKPVLFFLDQGMSELFGMALEVGDQLYGTVLAEAVRGALDGPVKKILNEAIDLAIALAGAERAVSCDLAPSKLLPPRSKDVNISGNLLFKGLDTVLNRFIGVHSLVDMNINDVMDLLTVGHMQPTTAANGEDKQAGKVLIAENVLTINYLNPDFGVMQFNLSNLSVAGLDTFEQFQLVHPSGTYSTVNEISLGSEQKPLKISTQCGLAITPDSHLQIDGTPIRNIFELRLTAVGMSLGTGMNLQINEDRLLTDKLHDFQYPSCIFEVLDGLDVRNLTLAMSDVYIELNCLSCSSKALPEISKTLSSKVGKIQLNDMLQSALNTLRNAKNDEGEWPMERLANRVLNDTLNTSAQGCINAQSGVNSSSHGSHDEFTGIYPAVTVVCNVLASLCFFMSCAIVAAYKCCRGKTDLAVNSTAEPGRQDQENDDSRMSMYQKLGENDLDEQSCPGRLRKKRSCCGRDGDGGDRALYRSSAVPPWARYSIPFFIASGMLILLGGHVSIGASVIATVHLGKDVVPLPPLFSFSLLNSIHDMWTAGVYPLALLIAVFSGLWPYVKFSLLLFSWMAPPWWITEGQRGTLLNCLDILGKWSLIDLIVLVLMMVASRFHITSPDSWVFLPPEVLQADIIVLPNWGIFGFLLMTVMQLIVTHVIIAFHRSDVQSILNTRDENTEEKGWKTRTRRICSHPFRCGGKGGIRVEFTKLGRGLIFGLGVVSILLILFGAWVYSFSFKFLGLAGIALGDGAETSYSLISVANAVYHDDVSSFILWGAFLSFCLAIPLAHLIVLLVLWALPMRLNMQRNLFLAAEVLDAWGALEVFILSLLAALLEINQFAKFIVGEKCGFIEPYLKDYFSALFPSGDSECFSVGVSFSAGTFTLMAAAIVGVIMGQVFTRLSEQALEDMAHDEAIVEDGASEKACGIQAAKKLANCMIRCKLMKRNYSRESYENGVEVEDSASAGHQPAAKSKVDLI